MRSARLWLGFIGEAGGRHYRTRDQLVSACVQRLIELDLLEIDIARVAERAMSPEQLADLGGDLMWHWITVDAHRHLARYELLLHSRRRPDLAADLVAAGEKLRSAMATVLDTQAARCRRRPPSGSSGASTAWSWTSSPAVAPSARCPDRTCGTSPSSSFELR
jgi:AcrR family transcriptional regulator